METSGAGYFTVKCRFIFIMAPGFFMGAFVDKECTTS
jgi:hypothetical protein